MVVDKLPIYNPAELTPDLLGLNPPSPEEPLPDACQPIEVITHPPGIQCLRKKLGELATDVKQTAKEMTGYAIITAGALTIIGGIACAMPSERWKEARKKELETLDARNRGESTEAEFQEAWRKRMEVEIDEGNDGTVGDEDEQP